MGGGSASWLSSPPGAGWQPADARSQCRPPAGAAVYPSKSEAVAERMADSDRAHFYCHLCRAVSTRLAEGDVCPHCGSDFVEEGEAGRIALEEVVHWLAEDEDVPSYDTTEVRIAQLLGELHEHLALVEGVHDVMSGLVESEVQTPKSLAAPKEVLDAVRNVRLDPATLRRMRQTPQCVVCCADFEPEEHLVELPGCGHLFHSECIRGWLGRAANCPICRCDLCEAVGVERDASPSTPSSVELDAAELRWEQEGLDDSQSIGVSSWASPGTGSTSLATLSPTSPLARGTSPTSPSFGVRGGGISSESADASSTLRPFSAPMREGDLRRTAGLSSPSGNGTASGSLWSRGRPTPSPHLRVAGLATLSRTPQRQSPQMVGVGSAMFSLSGRQGSRTSGRPPSGAAEYRPARPE